MALSGQTLEYRTTHKIRIEASANGGFVVCIGCCVLVFVDSDSLLAGLKKYFDQPLEWTRKYNDLTIDDVERPQDDTATEHSK